MGAGDALLLRWGRWTRKAKLGTWPINEGMAGFDNSVIPWLKKRDIAVIVACEHHTEWRVKQVLQIDYMRFSWTDSSARNTRDKCEVQAKNRCRIWGNGL